jgi:hypothetical protein
MFFKAVSQALAMNWNSLGNYCIHILILKDLWLLAVYYHFEMNNNPFRARKTFLKGLKMNSTNRVKLFVL